MHFSIQIVKQILYLLCIKCSHKPFRFLSCIKQTTLNDDEKKIIKDLDSQLDLILKELKNFESESKKAAERLEKGNEPFEYDENQGLPEKISELIYQLDIIFKATNDPTIKTRQSDCINFFKNLFKTDAVLCYNKEFENFKELLLGYDFNFNLFDKVIEIYNNFLLEDTLRYTLAFNVSRINMHRVIILENLTPFIEFAQKFDNHMKENMNENKNIKITTIKYLVENLGYFDNYFNHVVSSGTTIITYTEELADNFSYFINSWNELSEAEKFFVSKKTSIKFRYSIK